MLVLRSYTPCLSLRACSLRGIWRVFESSLESKAQLRASTMWLRVQGLWLGASGKALDEQIPGAAEA